MSIINISVAKVDLIVQNNQTFNYAFSFGDPLDASWSFDHQDLYMDIKRDAADETPVMSLNSLSPATILIIDSATRSIAFNVDDDDLRAALESDTYKYDLMMVDRTTGETVPLMGGDIKITEGVTKKPEP